MFRLLLEYGANPNVVNEGDVWVGNDGWLNDEDNGE
jgi:hypothetical protein